MPTTQTNDNPLFDIRPCVTQVLYVMELIYWNKCGPGPAWLALKPSAEDDVLSVTEDLPDLEYSPHKAVLIDQVRIIWNLVVRRRMPAIWFIRTHRPVTTVFSALCEMAQVSFPRFFHGELTESDFQRLTEAMRKLANSPLKICDASQPEMFRKALHLTASNPVDYVICDWVLDEEELALAQHFTRNSQTSLLYPRGF